MKTFKWVCVNIVVLVAVLYSVGLALPKSYFVERKVAINAPPRVIFEHVNNLRDWLTWTPWPPSQIPKESVVFGDTDQGAATQYSWKTSADGTSTVAITGSNMGYGIGYSVNLNGGAQRSVGLFRFTPTENGTELAWTNECELGKSSIDGYRCLLFNYSVAAELEAGLAKLKHQVEAAQQKEANEVANKAATQQKAATDPSASERATEQDAATKPKETTEQREATKGPQEPAAGNDELNSDSP